MRDGFDTTIVGAGVVGCAVASAVSRRGDSVLVLERETLEGAGTTSRNSGVLHGGLYYPPRSRKAQSCLRGLELTYAWVAAHGVDHRRCGKLVVASTEAEEDALHRLLANARDSGAQGVQLWSTTQVATHEPDLWPPRLALWSERTGIVDAHSLTRSLRADAEAHGAVFAMRGQVLGIDTRPSGYHLTTSRGPIDSARVVNAAGLHSDEVARMVGLTGYTIHPCRGDYFRLTTRATYNSLIYPIRPSGYPGLGVHLTLGLDGSIRMGPDAQFVSRKDAFGPAVHKHEAFLEATRQLLGPVRPDQLTYDGCGLRPTLRTPDETQNHDFTIVEQPSGCVHLLGIESPGLTAAMALAEEVACLTA